MQKCSMKPILNFSSNYNLNNIIQNEVSIKFKGPICTHRVSLSPRSAGWKVAVMLSTLTMANYKGAQYTHGKAQHTQRLTSIGELAAFSHLFSDPFKSRHNVALEDLKRSDVLESFLARVCSGGLSIWLWPRDSRKTPPHPDHAPWRTHQKGFCFFHTNFVGLLLTICVC